MDGKERSRSAASPGSDSKISAQKSGLGGGPNSTVDSILASHPAAPGLILGIPKIFSDLDVVEIYRQRALLRQRTVQRA